jgi:hypothetical protein
MTTTKLRKIHVLNENYLWKREHIHLDSFVDSKCAERVTIFMEGKRRSFLKLVFKEDDNRLLKPGQETWLVGYPDTGVVWNNKKSINFNRPAVIAALIHHFRCHQWAPGTATKPYVLEDALTILNDIELPLG